MRSTTKIVADGLGLPLWLLSLPHLRLCIVWRSETAIMASVPASFNAVHIMHTAKDLPSNKFI